MPEVAVYNDLQHEQFTCSNDRFALYRDTTAAGKWRLLNEPREQEHAEAICFAITVEGLTVTKSSVDASVYLADGNVARLGQALPLPCVLRSGSTWIEISRQHEPRTMVPLLPTELIDFADGQSSDDDQFSGPSSETITKWLSEAGQLHRAAAKSPEFYADAARFAVETVGLDAAWVVSRCGDQWEIVGSCLPHPEHGVRFSASSLSLLQMRNAAWYQPTPEDASSTPCSSSVNQALVIAPVFDVDETLTAAIYGVRNTYGDNRRRGVRPLEARLVQLLAESVAVGIARLDQETEAARTRVLLEHAFSPTVAEYIQRHPECLSGQMREVSLLFADLRGYTSLAESMQPADCYELLGDVMESLTQVVMHHGGVVVDYYGDGLLALWNAPLEQAHHPDLACAAALEMFEAMPAVAQKWSTRIEAPLELGIGVHSGPAHVGNVGTRSRIKYGASGNTVNVASRVQAASKQLGLPLVITAATQTKLTSKFFALRACTAKLPGLEQPIELYTVYPASTASRVKSRLDQYARALELFELGEIDGAEELLSELLKSGQVTPAHFLAHYTAAQINGNHGRRAVDKYAVSQGSVIEILGK